MVDDDRDMKAQNNDSSDKEGNYLDAMPASVEQFSCYLVSHGSYVLMLSLFCVAVLLTSYLSK